MAQLAKWPEIEVEKNPLDPEGAAVAPAEIRFQIKPGAGEEWDTHLAAECTVGDREAPTPGAALSFREWEKDAEPTYYCYALARDLRDGEKVTLKVRPHGKGKHGGSEAVWEQEFQVRAEGDAFRLE